MIIDFHTHAFDDRVVEKAMAVLSENCGQQPLCDGTVKGALQKAREEGADKILVAPIATRSRQQAAINDWAAGINHGDVFALGSVHPDADDALAELERIKQLGLKGIKLHPEYQDFFVDDPKLWPVYEKAAQLGLIVLFHAGVDIGYPAPYHCTPERLKKALPVLKGAHVIAAHMGGFRMWDEVEEHLCGRELYLDTAYTAGHLSPEQMTRMIRRHGADKILFASDLPWHSTGEHIRLVNSLPISETEKAQILGENAARLLGLV